MNEHVKIVPLDQNNLDHLNLMYSVRTHPEVDKQLCTPPPKSFTQHVQYLEKAVKSGLRKFFILYYQDNLCGYCHTFSQGDALELGWALHPDWWGKGIGKRSVGLFIQYLHASGQSRGKLLTLIVKKENVKALSIYKKSGFVILSEDSLMYTLAFNSI